MKKVHRTEQIRLLSLLKKAMVKSYSMKSFDPQYELISAVIQTQVFKINDLMKGTQE